MSTRAKRTGLVVLAVVAVGLAAGAFLLDPEGRLRGRVRGEPFFAGRAASAWAGDLGNPDENARAAAVGKLKDGKADAVPVLAAVLAGDGNTEARTRAADVLGQIGAPARPAGPALIAALNDPDPLVRAVATRALDQLAPDVPGAVTALVERFPDVEAVRAVARYGPTAGEAVPKLVELLAHESDKVRWNAARTLGKIGPPAVPAVPPLVKAMAGDPDADVREHAAEALGDIGPPAAAAVPDLAKALADREWKVRRDAVRSLGKMGVAAASALDRVRALKTDPEVKVREAATAAEQLIEPNKSAREPRPRTDGKKDDDD